MVQKNNEIGASSSFGEVKANVTPLLQASISSHTARVLSLDRDSWITTTWEKLRQRALQFYKIVQVHPRKLAENVAIEYNGEDVGLLR